MALTPASVAAGQRRPMRRVARRRPRVRRAAVAEHEVRADVGGARGRSRWRASWWPTSVRERVLREHCSRVRRRTRPGVARRAGIALIVPYVAVAGRVVLCSSTPSGERRSPQAPYGELVQTDLKNLIFGAPGLLFDQEYGLLPYAPVYILAATGLWRCGATAASARRVAIEIVIALRCAARHGRRLPHLVGRHGVAWTAADLGAAAARAAHRHRVSQRSPPAAPGAPPTSAACGSASASPAWCCSAQNGLLISQRPRRHVGLLEYLSPRWPAWTLRAVVHLSRSPAPRSCTRGVADARGARRVAFSLDPCRYARHRVARRHRDAVVAGACRRRVVAAASAGHRRPGRPSTSRARPRLPLLDEFDAWPAGRSRVHAPACHVGTSSVRRTPRSRSGRASRDEPQPIRVLHNGRFSLPAGRYRLEIEWSGRARGETIGLQIGRTGEPGATWTVEPRPGERWSVEFALPLDAGFVGLRGTPELERAIVTDCDRAHLGGRRGQTAASADGDGGVAVWTDRCSSTTRTSSRRRRLLGARRRDDACHDSARATPTRTAHAARSQRAHRESAAASRRGAGRRRSRCSRELPDRDRDPGERPRRWSRSTRRGVEGSCRANSIRPPATPDRWASGSRSFAMKDLRREYASRSLDDGTADADPIAQFRVWFDEALAAQAARCQRDEPGHGVSLPASRRCARSC